MIEYSVFDALRAGFSRVIFVIRAEIKAQLERLVVARFADRIDCSFVVQALDALPEGVQIPKEREKPWGTGHAVLVAGEKIGEPFAVINADDYYGLESFKIVCDFLGTSRREQDSNHCLVAYQLEKTLSNFGPVSRAICDVDSEGYLKSLHEQPEISRESQGIIARTPNGSRVALKPDLPGSMNLMGFSPSIFHHLASCFKEFVRTQDQDPNAEFYLPHAVNEMIGIGTARVKVFHTEERWFGMTHGSDRDHARKEVHRLVSTGVYPVNLWAS